jgi:hypothetical protein
MRKLSFFDKFLMVGIIIIVIGIFILAFTIKSGGGSCVVDPCSYIAKHNDGKAQCIIYVDKETGQSQFNLLQFNDNNSLNNVNP